MGGLAHGDGDPQRGPEEPCDPPQVAVPSAESHGATSDGNPKQASLPAVVHAAQQSWQPPTAALPPAAEQQADEGGSEWKAWLNDLGYCAS